MANPNPSPETRFKPGEAPNPGGKTSEQRQREIANAERATKLRGRLLVALEKRLDQADEMGDTKASEAIQADILRLLKDSEDRGLGTPVATVHGAGPDGEHLIKTEEVTRDADAFASTVRRLAAGFAAAGSEPTT